MTDAAAATVNPSPRADILVRSILRGDLLLAVSANTKSGVLGQSEYFGVRLMTAVSAKVSATHRACLCVCLCVIVRV
jgi:hypothetical protein